MKGKQIRIILLSFVLVFIVGIIAVNWLEKALEKKIRALHYLDFERMQIDVLNRQINFFKLSAEVKGFSGDVEAVMLRNIDILNILRSEVYHVGELHIEGLDLQYHMRNESGKAEQSDTLGSSTEKKFNKKLPTIRIDKLHVNNGSFTLFDRLDSLIVKSKINAQLQNLDEGYVNAPGKLPAQLQFMKLDSAYYYSKDGIYILSSKRMTYENNELKLLGLSFNSTVKPMEIGALKGFETPWFDLSVDSINIRTADMGTILANPELVSMNIYQPRLTVFKDKRPPYPEDKRPPLIRDLLANKSFKFVLDTVNINNGSIRYEQLNVVEKGSGYISFDRLNAQLTDFSSYALRENIKPRLRASCYLYNQAAIYADFSFPSDPDEQITHVKGKILPFKLTLLNEMIGKISNLKIKSGRSNSLDFDFKYTAKLAEGSLNFSYEDLHLAFTSKRHDKHFNWLNDAKSFLIDRLIINKRNDPNKKNFKKGLIHFKRVENRAVFHYWWGAIRTGLLTTI